MECESEAGSGWVGEREETEREEEEDALILPLAF